MLQVESCNGRSDIRRGEGEMSILAPASHIPPGSARVHAVMNHADFSSKKSEYGSRPTIINSLRLMHEWRKKTVQSIQGIEMSDVKSAKVEFFKTEYEKSLEIVFELHQSRLAYQKFYVSIVGSIIALAVIFSRIFPEKPADTGIFNYQYLLAILFLSSSVVGYIVVKNLVSIRKNEVFWTNFAIDLRDNMIVELCIGGNYPVLGKARSTDPSSSDFQTIVACSILNIFTVIAGSILIVPPNTTLITIFPVAIIFIFIHYKATSSLSLPINRSLS